VLRVQSAKRRTKKMPPGQEEWLIIEHEKSGDFKYYLSSMSARSTFKSRVRLAKMRWHVERDYQDMKQELGFDRYEERSWGDSTVTWRWSPECMLSSPSTWRIFPPQDSLTKWTWNDFRRAVAQVLIRWIGHCATCLRFFEQFPGQKLIR